TSSASSTTAPAPPSPLQVGDRDDSADARGHVKGALRASYAIGVRRPLIWEPLTRRAISEEDGGEQWPTSGPYRSHWQAAAGSCCGGRWAIVSFPFFKTPIKMWY